jgi:hypothetical protein
MKYTKIVEIKVVNKKELQKNIKKADKLLNKINKWRPVYKLVEK